MDTLEKASSVVIVDPSLLRGQAYQTARQKYVAQMAKATEPWWKHLEPLKTLPGK